MRQGFCNTCNNSICFWKMKRDVKDLLRMHFTDCFVPCVNCGKRKGRGNNDHFSIAKNIRAKLNRERILFSFYFLLNCFLIVIVKKIFENFKKLAYCFRNTKLENLQNPRI